LKPASPPLRRLLKRPGLLVLHAYGPHPHEVSGPELEALLDQVERYHEGEAPPHSAFLLAEFRDRRRPGDAGHEEMC
jgi:hypothetical protein